jgi:cytochrome c peroxidase
MPSNNAVTREKIDLGRRLFMDRRLSFNNTLSCAMCHVPEQGFTSNELRTSVGIEGRTVRRNAPTLFNVAYLTRLFLDGRETSLENQVWSPVLAYNEMDNPSIGYVVDKIKTLPEYRGLFERAFGSGPDMLTLSQAIATYERTLVSGNSRFDRWFYGHDANALTEEERRGFEIFRGKGRCVACHTIGDTYALFTDNGFHNTGIGFALSMSASRTYKVQLAPGVVVEVGASMLDQFEQPLPDVGRAEVTLKPEDRWAYRTASLRNIALTAPYMHDGSLPTLEAVVDFYDGGGTDSPDKDPVLEPLGLTSSEKQDLLAFLRSLTGDNVEALVQDARKVRENSPIP